MKGEYDYEKLSSTIIIASLLMFSFGASASASGHISEISSNNDVISESGDIISETVDRGELLFDGEAVSETIISDNGETLLLTLQEIPTNQPFAIGRGSRSIVAAVSTVGGQNKSRYRFDMAYEYDTNRDYAYFSRSTFSYIDGVRFHFYYGLGQNSNTYGGSIYFGINSSGRFTYSTSGYLYV